MHPDDDFDFSDVTPDGVREILDVAVGVLQDYGTSGNTRIERMARFLLTNLKADTVVDDYTIFSPDYCREMATYWLLSAERQEH